MKKNRMLFSLVLLIILVIFNVIAFVPSIVHGGTFWCGYILTTVALLLQIVFALIAFGNAGNIKKTFFSLPVAQLGTTYLVVQMIWGLICLFCSAINAKFAIILSVLLLGVYLIAIIVAVIGRNVVTDIDTKVKVKTFFIKSMLLDLETLTAKADNVEIRSTLNAITETVKYSDPMSNDALQNVEGRISDKFYELEGAVESNNIEEVAIICKAIDTLFVERNKKCKLLK